MDGAPRFRAALALVLEVEGGHVNDPHDPGGKTNLGISSAANPDIDLAQLTRDRAARLYYDRYWVPARCGRLPPPWDVLLFDYSVNSGPTTAVRALQRVVGTTPDGVVGPLTVAACRAAGLEGAARYLARRLEHLQGLDGWSRYGRGWTYRVMRVALEAMG